MSAPPVLNSASLRSADVDAALRAWGGFLLEVGDGQLPWRDVLKAAHDLFARPRAAKTGLAIERSAHFRGWSEMHNQRDWREQIHLGREMPEAGSSPAFLRLEGPNLWPSDPDWRRAVTRYMNAGAALGEAVLARLGEALQLDDAPFAGVGGDGYLVMKLIGYHPQAAPTALRPGVAPHVDFSWLTLTLQDSPGLEVRAPDGRWVLIEPRPATIWVHAGELLQHATRGRCVAAPHRVINQSVERTRVSVPLFLNPPLTTDVPVFGLASPASPVGATIREDEQDHIHRVLPGQGPYAPFHFGEAEWRRKGLGRWCAACVPDIRD